MSIYTFSPGWQRHLGLAHPVQSHYRQRKSRATFPRKTGGEIISRRHRTCCWNRTPRGWPIVLVLIECRSMPTFPSTTRLQQRHHETQNHEWISVFDIQHPSGGEDVSWSHFKDHTVTCTTAWRMECAGPVRADSVVRSILGPEAMSTLLGMQIGANNPPWL